MDHLKFFKGCLPQILLSPFLNTFTQMSLKSAYETSAYETSAYETFLKKRKKKKKNQLL